LSRATSRCQRLFQEIVRTAAFDVAWTAASMPACAAHHDEGSRGNVMQALQELHAVQAGSQISQETREGSRVSSPLQKLSPSEKMKSWILHRLKKYPLSWKDGRFSSTDARSGSIEGLFLVPVGRHDDNARRAAFPLYNDHASLHKNQGPIPDDRHGPW